MTWIRTTDSGSRSEPCAKQNDPATRRVVHFARKTSFAELGGSCTHPDSPSLRCQQPASARARKPRQARAGSTRSANAFFLIGDGLTAHAAHSSLKTRAEACEPASLTLRYCAAQANIRLPSLRMTRGCAKRARPRATHTRPSAAIQKSMQPCTSSSTAHLPKTKRPGYAPGRFVLTVRLCRRL